MEYTDITLPSGERISGGRCVALVSIGPGGVTTHFQCINPAQGQCPVCRHIYCDLHAINHWQRNHNPADLNTPDD